MTPLKEMRADGGGVDAWKLGGAEDAEDRVDGAGVRSGRVVVV